MNLAAIEAYERAMELGSRSIRTAIAECAAIAVALVLGISLVSLTLDPLISTIAVAIVSGAIVAWMGWHDLRTFTIPDGAVLALAIIAISCRYVGAVDVDSMSDISASLPATLFVDAVLPGGLLFALREIHYRRRGFDGLGFGDVKLAVVGGLFVGVLDFSWALFAAALSGLALVAGRSILAGTIPDSGARLAFGALLAPVLWLLWVARHLPVLAPLASF